MRNPVTGDLTPGLTRYAGLVSALFMVCAVLVVLTPSVAHGTDVIGDDEYDRFVGSGSLLLPPGIAESGRSSAAQCPGCRWRAVQTCDPTTPTACRGAARLCPHDSLWLKIYLARPGQDWQVIGSDCFSAGGPVTRELAEVRLNETLAEAVPTLHLSVRPPGGILPHLPVFAQTGQSVRSHQWDWNIVGLDLRVEATATWWWRTETVDLGPTRQPTMSFIYRHAGDCSINVATTWSARYWVHGVGPLTVTGQVRQAGSVDFVVGEARAVLVR